MIGIVEVFTNWQILGKRYSFPMTTIGYDANNPEAKKAARMVAENLDMLTIPLIPKTVDAFSAGGKTSYSVEVNPIPTQTTADAFRVFKEYIIEYRSEIMQLVTGGTLLGATEKTPTPSNSRRFIGTSTKTSSTGMRAWCSTCLTPTRCGTSWP